jgi:aminoglycoside 6'-N-acetyltransferase
MRLATPADAAVLERWDSMPHVRAAISDDGRSGFDCDWTAELAPRDDGSAYFVAEAGGQPIGAMQIIDPAREATRYWGDAAPDLRALDIWIGEPEFLDRGFGTRMMRWALTRCFTDPAVTAVLVDPLARNTRAHRFYQRLGFRFVERRRFDDHSDCFVFRLDRANWQAPGPTPPDACASPA